MRPKPVASPVEKRRAYPQPMPGHEPGFLFPEVYPMKYRNEIIKMLGRLEMEKHLALLSSNTFQAGLDALDPDCSCFVQDRAIQECIYLGLRYQMLTA
jgi:hypothetical protein